MFTLNPIPMSCSPIMPFVFYEIDSDESFQLLASTLGGTFSGDSIDITAEHGIGRIRKIKIEEGLHLRAWDIKIDKPFIFNKVADTSSANPLFHIIYILNPEALTLTTKNKKHFFTVRPGMNILFVSNDIDIDIEINTAEGVKALDVSFTASWLQNSFGDKDAGCLEFIQRLLDNPVPTVIFEYTNAEDYLLLSRAHLLILASTGHSLKIKSGTLSLLSNFFSNLLTHSPQETIKSKTIYCDKMMQAELILKAHLEKKLPPVDVIARQLAMSETNLKRHFKLMFGNSLYEHYLQLKMEHAKQILLKEPVSVNELAIKLEYETVSSFIEMFKKHHGFGPGSLRKKTA